MTDFSKVNIHCSSIGNIMGNSKRKSNKEKLEAEVLKLQQTEDKYNQLDDRKKDMATGFAMLERIKTLKVKIAEMEATKDVEPLSPGAKSHLKKVYGYFKYGKWCASADKGTKYTNKGTIAESDSIALLSRLRGMPYIKNEERVQNDYLTGIPDVFVGESIYKAQYIIDVKSSWDIESYLVNLGKPLYGKYWWQIQGYLAITGATVGEVAYCLVNTPQSLINNEIYRLKERMDVVTDEDPAFKAKESELINNLTFDDIPEKDRVLRFLIERDDDAIAKIYKKVEIHD